MSLAFDALTPGAFAIGVTEFADLAAARRTGQSSAEHFNPLSTSQGAEPWNIDVSAPRA
ncbi:MULTISPECIES: hypothetical protein [unclassified Mesorhizobium]|uniref:hypothetical protein n=1 Tax=unclassified Mesorhizobium TaxID=325217 RepID=UPI0013ECA4AA|nr:MULTISPECIES: hypothetical protein [unclassified Mesorhizobium]